MSIYFIDSLYVALCKAEEQGPLYTASEFIAAY